MRLAVSLFAALLAPPALAAPGAGDVERATTRVAQALDGVLRGCPASFARIGTPDKKCAGVGGTVEGARVKLGETLGADLYGVWRSRDEQRSVYNWVQTPGGYVYIRLQPDPDGRAQTLVYLDTPPGNSSATPSGTGSGARPAASTPAPSPVTVTRPAPAPAPVTRTPTPPARTAPQPAPQPRVQPTTPAASGNLASGNLAPVPFRRTLQVQAQRLNGRDVEALQNRLISLTRPSGGGRGDGWYGPITAATVRAFQEANGLPVTGRVDQPTWDVLFSEDARTFAASAIR